MKVLLFVGLLFSVGVKAQVSVTDKVGTILVVLQPSLAGVTGVLPFANGGITGNVATAASLGTVSVPMTSRIISMTPTGAATLNATGGVAGQEVYFIFTTSGTVSFVITFGTNYRVLSTLTTGTVTAKKFVVEFLFDGTVWLEVGRTTAL